MQAHRVSYLHDIPSMPFVCPISMVAYPKVKYICMGTHVLYFPAYIAAHFGMPASTQASTQASHACILVPIVTLSHH